MSCSLLTHLLRRVSYFITSNANITCISLQEFYKLLFAKTLTVLNKFQQYQNYIRKYGISSLIFSLISNSARVLWGTKYQEWYLIIYDIKISQYACIQKCFLLILLIWIKSCLFFCYWLSSLLISVVELHIKLYNNCCTTFLIPDIKFTEQVTLWWNELNVFQYLLSD